MPNTDIQTLRDLLGPVYDVRAAMGVLSWDQEVFMPPKGAAARGQQLSTLSGIAHRLFTDKKLGDTLNRLREATGLSGDDAKLVSETWHDYDRATKLPEEFVARFTEETSKAFQAWVRAKGESDFPAFRPHLETLVSLSREMADRLGYTGSPYNALLEEYERGMTAEQLRPMFAELAERQSALIDRIVKSPNRPNTNWLDAEWDTKQQWEFTLRLLRDMGYDFQSGRQDAAEHPFTTDFDVHDVRVTTHCYPDRFFAGFMASLHEGGHALYEQGLREEDRRTPLGQAISLGVHESQSRLWENLIGQSQPFWEHYGPVLRSYFPGQLGEVTDDDIYRAVNHVQPSLRRLDADECTYNLHIILRFEIEVDLVEGKLKVAEIPDRWRELMKRYFGLDVPDDARGCLQDVHWSHGALGYFPTYTLGNLYAAQMLEQIERDVPQLWEQVREGNFCALLGWLREHVHQVGRRKTAIELVRDVTHREPGSAPYLDYLERKYAALYGI